MLCEPDAPGYAALTIVGPDVGHELDRRLAHHPGRGWLGDSPESVGSFEPTAFDANEEAVIHGTSVPYS